jgi:hypothetical protein
MTFGEILGDGLGNALTALGIVLGEEDTMSDSVIENKWEGRDLTPD